jgi:hypothetical protein
MKAGNDGLNVMTNYAHIIPKFSNVLHCKVQSTIPAHVDISTQSPERKRNQVLDRAF